MMRARLVGALAIAIMLAVACGSSATVPSESTSAGAQTDPGSGAIVNWRSLGCAEPAPLVVQSSDALETDVGLAADSLAATYGVALDEAKRRLRLQEVLSRRLSEVRSAEAGRVARTELQHEPYFAAVVTLTGDGAITDRTRDLLCDTPELEVRVGALFTQDELVAETGRLSLLLGEFGSDLPSYGPTNGQLEFTVINDEIGARLDEFLSTTTQYPYVINSLQIPPLVLDPSIPFPLIDLTGRSSAGVGLSGLLTIEGPCVYLNEALVILPARETTWNAQTGVLNTGGGDLRSGDQVTGGGNEYRGSFEDLAQPPDPSCRVDQGVLQGSFAPLDPSATPAPRPPSLPPGDLPGLRVHPRSTGGGMDAEVGGILEISENCVWLSDGNGSRFPVVWPAGTFGRADTTEIVLPSGDSVTPGAGVQGGGGYVNAQRAMEGLGLPAFPPECVQSGEAAVFNSDSPIEVIPLEGALGGQVPVADTLVERFSVPEPIGLELIAVNPNGRSVAIIDFVTATVHLYPPSQYEGPPGAISGASGGGGFTHLWSNTTIYSYARLTRPPVVYQPEPLADVPGIASSLRVLPYPDGERTWLVQPGQGESPTTVELVTLTDEKLTRLATSSIEGSWLPVGTTPQGVVLTRQDGERTVLVDSTGAIMNEQLGVALSVSWHGAAILRPDGSLVTTDAVLGEGQPVNKLAPGEWSAVGGPTIPTDSPPLRTGAGDYLVRLADQLVVVAPNGNASALYDLGPTQAIASWSRASDWVVLMQDAELTLIPTQGGEPLPLGQLVPDDHWVLSAG